MIPINTSKKFNEHRPTLGPSFENIEFVPCWCFIFHELVEWFFINLYCYENVHPIHHNNQYVQIQTVTTHTICCINSARWWYELLQDPVQYNCDWLISELSKHLKTSYSAYHTHIKLRFEMKLARNKKYVVLKINFSNFKKPFPFFRIAKHFIFPVLDSFGEKNPSQIASQSCRTSINPFPLKFNCHSRTYILKFTLYKTQ